MKDQLRNKITKNITDKDKRQQQTLYTIEDKNEMIYDGKTHLKAATINCSTGEDVTSSTRISQILGRSRGGNESRQKLFFNCVLRVRFS